MSNESTNPVLKQILIAVSGVTILGAVLFVLLAIYIQDDYRVTRKLRARGFYVLYNWRNAMPWQSPTNIKIFDLRITPDDCRLICQLPRLQVLSFVRCDMSDLNLDEIGNCPELTHFMCRDMTPFPIDEMRKLVVCPIRYTQLSNVGLKDSDIENFAGLTQLRTIILDDNVGITDISFEYFEKIATLKRLSLSKTSVTKDGVEEFNKKRPDVEVKF